MNRNNIILNYCLLYAELRAERDNMNDYELESLHAGMDNYQAELDNEDDRKVDKILEILNLT